MFIQTAQKYVSIDALAPYALRELVQAIYVEASPAASGSRIFTSSVTDWDSSPWMN